MFHRVYRVTERPRASRIVPNRPRGCSLCLGAHGRFGLLCGANSATRPARRRVRLLGRFGTIPGSPDISTAHYVR
eukprot:scaffold45505_cov61-Phaeocystis_antarctica.AAC.4